LLIAPFCMVAKPQFGPSAKPMASQAENRAQTKMKKMKSFS